MPIMLAPLCRALSVVRVSSDEKTKRHLENLGIAAGAELSVLSNDSGSVILRVRDGRMALDKRVAAGIFVTVKEG